MIAEVFADKHYVSAMLHYKSPCVPTFPTQLSFTTLRPLTAQIIFTLPSPLMEPLIRIVEFTNDPSKVETSLYLSSDIWRESLTRDQHVSREKALEQRLLSHGMRTHRYSLEKFDEIRGGWCTVSTMDAVERPAIVKSKGFKPLPTVNYVFDAVFTPAEYRGKGYASVMLQQVIASIEKSHSERAHVGSQPPLITLWSDVGDYYTRVGFKRAQNARIIVSPSEAYQNPEPTLDGSGISDGYDDNSTEVTLLDREQSQIAIDYHRAMVVGAIDVMTEKDGVVRSIVAPTKGILDQMQWRSEFVSGCLGVTNPIFYGARTENGWAAWSYMMTERTLYILVMSGPIHEMVALYQAALQAARDVGGFEVVLYEADLVYPDRTLAQYFLDQLSRAGIEYTISEPEHSIPYFLGSSNKAVTWEFAGRYSWY